MLNGFNSGGTAAGLLALSKVYLPSLFSILRLIRIAIISLVLVRVFVLVRSG